VDDVVGKITEAPVEPTTASPQPKVEEKPVEKKRSPKPVVESKPRRTEPIEKNRIRPKVDPIAEALKKEEKEAAAKTTGAAAATRSHRSRRRKVSSTSRRSPPCFDKRDPSRQAVRRHAEFQYALGIA